MQLKLATFHDDEDAQDNLRFLNYINIRRGGKNTRQIFKYRIYFLLLRLNWHLRWIILSEVRWDEIIIPWRKTSQILRLAYGLD